MKLGLLLCEFLGFVCFWMNIKTQILKLFVPHFVEIYPVFVYLFVHVWIDMPT